MALRINICRAVFNQQKVIVFEQIERMRWIPQASALWKNPKVQIFPQIQTYIKSKLFQKWLDNRGFLQQKVWISFHQIQCSNYDKIRKTLLFSSVPTNLFPFLTRECQNKIQTFLSENALNKGITKESLDFSKVGICGQCV